MGAFPMKPAHSVLVIGIALWSAITLLATLSERKLNIFGDPVARSAYSSHDEYTSLNWLDPNRESFTCLFLRSDGSRRCGLDIGLGDGRRSGLDISQFNIARLAIKYEGPADKLRFSFRNAYKEVNTAIATTEYSYIDNAKYHSTILPLRGGAYVYDIPLDSLKVPSWWISQSHMADDDKGSPDRSNVIRVGFDVETPMPVGQHFFHVLGLTLVAPWLSAANAGWWLALSAFYFVIVGIIYNVFCLKSHIQEHQEEMFGLLGKLKEANNKSAHFKTLAMYDPLTGLLNRRAALDLVRDFSLRNSLAGTALVLLDIDHFKRVNDSYGHDIGDEVLQSVSELILQSLREGDAAIRWGGEEILVICPRTRQEGAESVAEKLRMQIAALRFPPHELTITASIGVASIAASDTFDQAFKRADEALYRAKNSGRNRVCSEADTGSSVPAASAGP